MQIILVAKQCAQTETFRVEVRRRKKKIREDQGENAISW